MNLKELERFVVTADEGSIVAAAARLGLSQPALTRSIAMLEDTVGAPLFDRLPRGMGLTSAGAILLPQAKLILRDSQRFTDTIAQLQTVSGGSVGFGITPSLLETIGLEAVKAFSGQYVGVSLTVHAAPLPELMQMLQDGRLDLCLATVGAEALPGELRLEPLFEQTLSFLVGEDHPLAKLSTVSYEVLSAQKWVVINAPAAIDALVKRFEANGAPPPFFNVRTLSLSLQKNLLLTGEYVAIMDQDVVRPELDQGRIRILQTKFAELWLKSGLLFRREAQSTPAAGALAQLIRQAAQSRHR